MQETVKGVLQEKLDCVSRLNQLQVRVHHLVSIGPQFIVTIHRSTCPCPCLNMASPSPPTQRDYDKAEQECQRYKTLYDAAKEEVRSITVTLEKHPLNK